MRIAGTAQLTAPREEVYDKLQDGRVLAATIPGVQSLEQLTDNHYKLSIMAGVASIKGVYDGEVVSVATESAQFVCHDGFGGGCSRHGEGGRHGHLDGERGWHAAFV